jgi:acyl-CoA synthetase (AMP-forming)/AMP-acid ligase II
MSWMPLREFTLADVIDRNARLHGDRLAFVAGERRVSHTEYATRVERLASALASIGLVAGDRVAVLAQNCMAYMELYGAAARLGVILVPVNWRLGPDEIAYVITDTTPAAIVAGIEYLSILEERRALFPSVKRYLSLGPATGHFESLDQLVDGAADLPAPIPCAAGGTGFVIMHTAAVGGRPRGALLSHGGLIAANLQFASCWQLSPQDVHLSVLPLFHAAGLGVTLAVQQAGGASIVLSRFDAHAVAQVIRLERVSVFAEFPPMLGSLLDSAQESGEDLSTLRHVTGLDAPETISRFEAMCPSARFWTAYGQTEVSGTVTTAPFRDKPGSAGRPTPLAQVRVVDELDRPLPAGQEGEIVVRGPVVFSGYWNRGSDNEFTFRNGWHHTGDMGRFDTEGYLWYCGRSPAKELIKPGGENVYPAEVEKALLEHPAIAEAVVFGVPDARWGEAIKAVCVRRAGLPVTASELIEFVGSRIARFKRPRDVVFSATLPRTAQGSPDRARVKKDFSDA